MLNKCLKQVSLTTLVKRQVSEYMAMQSLPASSSIATLKRSNKKIEWGQKLAKSVSSKLSDVDVKGAIRIIFSSKGLAPFDEATFNQLL